MSLLAAQVTNKFLDLISAAMRSGGLATPSVGLFTNTPALGRASLLADMTEPLFTGYARATPALEAAQVNANGDRIESYASVRFQPTATPTPGEIANGYFVMATISAVDYLLFAEYFDSPVPFSLTTDAVDLLVDVYFKNLLTYGGLAAVV